MTDEQAFHAYMQSAAACPHVCSPEFEAAVVAWHRRTEAGERFALDEVAEELGLPLQAFLYLWNTWVAAHAHIAKMKELN